MANKPIAPGVEDAPKIEFPCDYPITVVGDAAEDFESAITQIVIEHAADLDLATVRSRDSRNGRFRSVKFVISATGEQQLKSLTDALMATGRVKMVI